MIQGDNHRKMAENARQLFLKFDQEELLRKVPLKHDANSIFLLFCGLWHRIRRQDGAVFFSPEPAVPGEPCPSAEDLCEPAAFSAILSVYDLLTRSEHPPKMTGDWVDLSVLASKSGAAPTGFAMLSRRLAPFAGKIRDLEEACLAIGGISKKGGDVSFLLPVCDGLLVWFQYWDADEEFPASIQFLWDRCSGKHFHFETLWYIMDFLIERITEKGPSVHE